VTESVAAPTLPRIVFDNSLPLNVLLTLALVPAAAQFTGLDDWLHQARADLPAGLLQEMVLLMRFPGGHLRFVEAVAAHAVASEEQVHASFDAWRTYLEALPPATFQSMALYALRQGIQAETVADEDLLDPQYLRAFLIARDPERDPSPAVAFVLAPAGLRARFLAALDQFWAQLYGAVYETCRPLLERSVAQHRAQRYAVEVAETFRLVTGRVLPGEVLFYLPGFRWVRFMPSCHLGERVAFFRGKEGLTVFYGIAEA
jgi:hypothetical protein